VTNGTHIPASNQNHSLLQASQAKRKHLKARQNRKKQAPPSAPKSTRHSTGGDSIDSIKVHNKRLLPLFQLRRLRMALSSGTAGRLALGDTTTSDTGYDATTNSPNVYCPPFRLSPSPNSGFSNHTSIHDEQAHLEVLQQFLDAALCDELNDCHIDPLSDNTPPPDPCIRFEDGEKQFQPNVGGRSTPKPYDRPSNIHKRRRYARRIEEALAVPRLEQSFGSLSCT
jgi:hypothetical protein